MIDPCSNCDDDEVCVRSGELGQPECQEGSRILYTMYMWPTGKRPAIVGHLQCRMIKKHQSWG